MIFFKRSEFKLRIAFFILNLKGNNIQRLKLSAKYLTVVSAILLLLSLTAISWNHVHAQDEAGTSRSRSDNPTLLRNYVVDETGTLTNSQVNALTQKLRQLEEQTSNQFVVYIIPSLDGESLEDLSIRLAEKNKIGKKEKNNGVLLLIVKNDRKIRIEVGYGLEGALTDAASSSIIRNEIAPKFKQGNYYDGINAGIDAMIAVTKGEYTAEKSSQKGSGVCGGVPFFVILIFMIIIMFIITSAIRNSFGRGKTMYGSKRGWKSVPWIISSGGSSSGSSWGSSGGFSGGGGSFGGGGASGSW